MQDQDVDGQAIPPHQARESIHATLERSRSTMYVAGWTTIMLIWGCIVALGNLSTYAVETWAPAFAEANPWHPGPLWGGLGLAGMAASALIGHRASKRLGEGPTATAAGLRVFAFWVSVVAAAFIIPAASGLWAGDADGLAIMGVAMGVVSLGYVLFGILHHPAIALVGLGIAASFYLSVHLAGDAWPLSSALLMPAVVLLAWMWVRKSEMA